MRTSPIALRSREFFRARMRNSRRLLEIYSNSTSMDPQRHLEEVGFIHALMPRSLVLKNQMLLAARKNSPRLGTKA